MLRRFIAGLLLALSTFAAFAETVYEYRITDTASGGYDSGWDTNAAAVASAYWAWKQSKSVCGLSRITYASNGVFNLTTSPYSTANTQQIRCSDNAVISSGTATVQLTKRILACTVGLTKERTYFSGWSTDVSGTNMVGGDVLPPFKLCDASCNAPISRVVSCHSETVPSPNGYYRGVCTYEYTQDGTNCTVPTETPPDTPEPPATNPPPGPDPTGPGPSTPEAPSGPPDTNGDPGTNPDGTPCGNEGEAACGTPTTTEGGANGGTSSAGSQTPIDPAQEGKSCGAPGQPNCSVNINETGTVDTDQTTNAASDRMDYQGIVTGEGGNGGKVKDWTSLLKNMNPGNVFGSTDWSWTFQFPTGCTPLVLDGYNVTIDVCRFQSMIHDLMSMIWLISTFFGVLYVARSTM